MHTTLPLLKSFVIIVALSYSTLSFSQNDLGVNTGHYCNKAHAARNLFNPLLKVNALTNTYDLKYYRFEWEIDPAVYAIKGKATPYFKVLSDNFKEIFFDFSASLTIDSIRYDGQNLNYQRIGDNTLRVDLPNVIENESIDSMTIAYHGVPPSGGFGSFIQDTHGSNEPVLWTLSEPFGAQDWWPCKNGLDDKIDSIDVLITTNAKYRAASNGTLAVEKVLNNGQKLYHWKHRYAIAPYLVAIAVTNYEAYTDNVVLSDGTTMPMLNFVYPESLATARKGTSDNVKALQFYDSLFIDYPFKKEKYGHAQFGWGGGMEHQTMSFVVNFDWGLLAHELGHQWFGDYVTCGSWEDIWLNEGFATYLEGLTRERFESPDSWQNWKSGKVNSITSNPNGSVKVNDITSVNRIFSGRLSYNKGSYLLHSLRWLLGDEKFFEGIRSYLNKKGFGYAVTGEFKDELSAVSGINLDEYFRDWFQGEGYPTYDILWDRNSTGIVIKANQITSNASVSFFEMPLPIRLTGQGKEKWIRLDHTFSGQIFEVPTDFVVENIEFDPTLWIASKNTVTKTTISATENEVLANFEIYPNPTNGILTIKTNEGFEGEFSITTQLGVLIYNGKLTHSVTELDLSNTVAGVYYVKIINGKNAIEKKFVKVN